MTRLLHLAPVVHPSSCPMSEKLYSEFENKIMNRLKDERIDVAFCEGKCEAPSYKEIRADYPIYGFLADKGARFEKTEDLTVLLLHKFIIESGYHPAIQRFTKRVSDFCVKRRDFVMGRNVSERLKDNETGFLIFGSLHQPEDYIRLLAPDIEMIYVTTRRHVENEMNSKCMNCPGH